MNDFQHVSITCLDLERSVRFYERLGLKVIKRLGEVNEQGIAQGFQLPRGRLAVAYLAPPQASSKLFIDLVQWLEPPSTGETYPALNHVGINRIAFRVSDKPDTFDFLGVTHISWKKRDGSFVVKSRRSVSGCESSLRKSSSNLNRTHDPNVQTGKWLKSVVQGYFNYYYAVPGNTDSLRVFRFWVTQMWRKALFRRSQ